jgi:hypothetical protein
VKPIDYATLDLLKRNHPAWRMLCSDHAPLVASFLNRTFVAPNVRTLSQADLKELLEDQLFWEVMIETAQRHAQNFSRLTNKLRKGYPGMLFN